MIAEMRFVVATLYITALPPHIQAYFHKIGCDKSDDQSPGFCLGHKVRCRTGIFKLRSAGLNPTCQASSFGGRDILSIMK